jgi:membrane protease YdiL (CAAX protease family)
MPASAAILLAFVFLGLPYLAWSAKRTLDAGVTFPRLPFYLQSVVLQTGLLVWGLWVAARNGIAIFGEEIRGIDALLAAVLLAAALGGMMAAWRFASPETRRRLALIVPQSDRERLVWIAVSAAAAAGEEVVYRGVTVAILQRVIDHWFTAALLTSIAFGLAHLVQGWKNAVFVIVFGLAFHLLVRASGNLYGAIAVHFLYDVITGFYLGRKVQS